MIRRLMPGPSGPFRAGLWVLLAVVVVVALGIGVTDRTPATPDQQAHAIGKTIMCPACSGETVTDSQAPVAILIRRQIAERVAEGQSAQEIRDAMAATYGNRVILNPPKSGLAGVVWVLPVAALVAALAGLVVAFRRWRVPAGALATADDVAVADRARRA